MNPMRYKNEKHQSEFEEAIRKKDKKDYAMMAALYLLTADLRLWNLSRNHTLPSLSAVAYISTATPLSETPYRWKRLPSGRPWENTRALFGTQATANETADFPP